MRPRRQDPTLLLVEDDDDVRESLLDVLHALMPEVRVVAVTDGEAGLEALQEHAVQGILCDYKLPGMAGLEFLKKARVLRPQAGRVLVTGFHELEVPQADIDAAGLAAVVTKPLDPETLIGAVKTAMGE